MRCAGKEDSSVQQSPLNPGLASSLVSLRPWSPLPTTSLSEVSSVCGQLQSGKTKWKIMKVDNSCMVHFSA